MSLSLESCHWRVFGKLCLNGPELKMTGLLRRKPEKAGRFWASPRPPGLPKRTAAFFRLLPHSSPASEGPPVMDLPFLGSGFSGVGWATVSVCPGLKGYPDWGSFLFPNQNNPRTAGASWSPYLGALSLFCDCCSESWNRFCGRLTRLDIQPP